jgi:diguanylate cyclase (GGDEF)-like protein/PAS domain S-box-containing protein
MKRGDAEVQMALRGEKEFDTEFRVVWPDGTIRHIAALARVHRNAVGQPTKLIGTNYDITDRRQVEDALRESEKRLSNIIHGFSIPTFVIGKDHKVLYWNQVLERLSKIPAAEVVGTNQHWRAFYTQERPCMADLLVDEVIDKIPQWYEGKYIKSRLIDGAYEATDFFPALGEKGNWLRFTAAAVRDFHGNLVGAVETLEDVTERKQAEEALRESEERFCKLADSTWEGIIIHRGGIILDVNESILKMFGWQAEELIGKSVLEFLAPESIGPALQKLKETIDTPQLYLEAMGLRKNKTVFPIEVLGRPIRYKNLDARVIAIRDITERKRAEERLRESEEKYRTLVETTRDLIYTADRKGFLTYMNPTLERTLGYTHDEWNGKTFGQIVASECIDSVRDIFKRAVRGESIPVYEVDLIRKDGTRLSVEFNVSTIYDNEGKPAGRYGIGRDITDRKQSEEVLRIHNQRFFGVLNSLDALVYVTDMQTNELLFVNKYGRDIWGDIEGKICWQTIQAGQTGPCEFCTNDRLVRPDGKPTEGIVWEFQNTVNGCWYECRDRAIYWPDGHIVRMEIATDITGHKQSEEALDRYRKQLKLILESVGDGIYGVDLNGRTAFANPSALRITGYEVGDIVGMDQHTILHHTKADGSPYPVEECQIHRTLRDGKIRHVSDETFWKKDGTSFPVEYVVTPMIENNLSTGAVVIFKDITERKQAEALLRESENRYRELSIIDALTQLYNSRHFYNQLRMEIDRVDRYGQPLTLLLLDLDDFKQFNDAYGHIEGDQVLSRFGQVVKRCLRQTDSAYRYGGEEFTILLPLTTRKDGAVTAERIRAELKEEIFSPVSGKDVHMTVSIGLAQYKSQEDMKTFVHRVDQLMYQAKKNGKDRVCPES